MRKPLVFFIFAFSFSQTYPVRISEKACLSADKALDLANQRAEFSNGVNWEIEIVDSCPFPAIDFDALAIDSVNKPHIVYGRQCPHKIIYAYPIVSGWHKEVVESGLFCYAFSLAFDNNNVAHLSYYRKDNSVDKTYICYARRDTAGWQIEVVDSSNGYLGNYFLNFNSSIDLDTSGLPGIAYYAWNVADSLHYIKYAYYNGIDWDTSIVARDTTWHHRYPLDYSPSLEFDCKSTPHIAFHRIRGDTDTIKIGYYDDTLSTWIISPAICYPYGGYPISLVLDSQDYPCIAHGWDAAVAYSWWDGSAWNTEITGTTMGWIGIRIDLDLDSLDNPHIAYLPDPLIGHPCYSYKENGIWYNCGWIEPDSSTLTVDADISFALDNNDQPHVCYPIEDYHFKYAKGTFVGIEEASSKMPELRYALEVYPNPFSKLTNISIDRVHLDRRTHSSYGTSSTERIELKIYDASGRLIRDFLLPTAYFIVPTVISWDGIDDFGRSVARGVYFISLSCNGISVDKKVILLR